MPSYRVRIDGDQDDDLIKFFDEYTDRYVLVHHTTLTDNPHYHAYCETKYTQGNFSNKIKQVLKVTGGDYSNKTCNDDRKNEYLSYLFNTKKGNVSRLVKFVEFSIIDIKIHQEQAMTIAKDFKAKLSASKKTQIDIALIVLERCDSPHASVIYEEVISVLKEHRMMARPNHVKDIIATVMAYSPDRRAREQIKDLTLKFFSNS